MRFLDEDYSEFYSQPGGCKSSGVSQSGGCCSKVTTVVPTYRLCWLLTRFEGYSVDCGSGLKAVVVI